MSLFTLPIPLSWLAWAHVLAGATALFTFAIPLVSAKGGSTHVKSGWTYAFAMVVVSLSAFVITPWRYFYDESRTVKSQDFALFLFFISLYSLATLQQGIHVFKFKRRTIAVKTPLTLLLPILLGVASALLFVKGLLDQKWLFSIFAVSAGQSVYKQLKFWLTTPTHPKSWFFFHLENMFICCITTVTAFAVTAIPRIFSGFATDSLWIWLAPTFIMIPWMIWFQRRYEKKFGVAAALLLFITSTTHATPLKELLSPYGKAGNFSGSVLLSCDGKKTEIASFGECDRENKIKCEPQTKFRIGSVSKSFTAAALLRLVEDKKLSLTTEVHALIPEYQKQFLELEGEPVRVLHLLNHTSGLPTLEPLKGFLERVWVSTIGLNEFPGFAAGLSLKSKPGTKFEYSNLGYNLSALILTRLGKTGDFEKDMREQVLSRLSLPETGISIPYTQLAKGYTKIEGKWWSMYDEPAFIDRNLTMASGSGNLYSTVKDLELWVKGLVGEKVIGKKLLEEMLTPGLEDFGYGWKKLRFSQTDIYWHNGAVSPLGYYSELGFTRDGKNVFAVLTNLDIEHVNMKAIQALYAEFTQRCGL